MKAPEKKKAGTSSNVMVNLPYFAISIAAIEIYILRLIALEETKTLFPEAPEKINN